MERYAPVAKGSERIPQFHGKDQKDSQQHEPPRELPVEYAVDHRRHQARLRRGSFVAADSLHPLNLHAMTIRIIKIFAIWDDARTKSVNEGVGLALIDVTWIFHLHARRQVRDIHLDLYGFVFRQAKIHQLERAADNENRSHCADDQCDLLL